MGTFLILDKVSLAILTSYQADTPSQHNYGGPWGDPNITAHVQLPDGMDKDCIDIARVDGDIVITADAGKVTAKATATALATASSMLDAAMAFGNNLIKQTALQNMALGITAAGKTGEVRKAMSEVTSALQTGSLYDAIDELRAIPSDAKDATYITDARLLAAINQLESFLGLPPSESL